MCAPVAYAAWHQSSQSTHDHNAAFRPFATKGAMSIFKMPRLGNHQPSHCDTLDAAATLIAGVAPSVLDRFRKNDDSQAVQEAVESALKAVAKSQEGYHIQAMGEFQEIKNELRTLALHLSAVDTILAGVAALAFAVIAVHEALQIDSSSRQLNPKLIQVKSEVQAFLSHPAMKEYLAIGKARVSDEDITLMLRHLQQAVTGAIIDLNGLIDRNSKHFLMCCFLAVLASGWALRSGNNAFREHQLEEQRQRRPYCHVTNPCGDARWAVVGAVQYQVGFGVVVPGVTAIWCWNGGHEMREKLRDLEQVLEQLTTAQSHSNAIVFFDKRLTV